MFSSGYLGILNAVFPLFSPLLNSDKVFSSIFTLVDCGWMNFTIGSFPFYSAILGFRGYHWFPPFTLLNTRTNVVPATLVAGPFFILNYFLLLRFPLQKAPCWLSRSGGILESWLLFFPSLRLLDSTSSDPPFGCFPFCHFSQVNWFLSARLKDPKPPSFMVLPPGFPKVPNPYSWVVGSQALWPHYWVSNKDIFVFIPYISWHAPLKLS